MKNIYQILQRPIVTEKSNIAKELNNQVSFFVALTSNRKQIKEAVETIFKVKVEGVRTYIVRGKIKKVGRSVGKRQNVKKAIVTLKDGYKIDFLGGS